MNFVQGRAQAAQRQYPQREILEKAALATDKQFKTRFAMKPSTYEALMAEVGDLLKPGLHATSSALCEDEQMLLFLRFARGNNCYLDYDVK